MKKIESEDFINRKLNLIKRLLAKYIRILSIANLVTILRFIGVATEEEQLLTIENGAFIVFDSFINILFGAEVFKLHRERQYLKVVSAAIKSDDNFVIQETEETFNNSLAKRSKEYYKRQKKGDNRIF